MYFGSERMKITKIEKQKNNQDRWSVFIDGEFAFGVTTEEVFVFKLTVGKEISEIELEKMIKEKDYSKAKDVALKFLSYRARSEKELRDKLISKEFDPVTIDRVIEFLKRYDYVNDEKFAKSYVRERIRLKFEGRKKLIYDLKQKGIKQEIIDHVLNNTDINEIDHALKLLEKKVPDKTELGLKEKQRIYQFLLRKGFSYDIIQKAFNVYFH
ncbi:MAG: recombination regulator RecX [Defluviitaleaceae bacterium]|nr:recombination regulator RecX [Defluviitaleaceae bacterium]